MTQHQVVGSNTIITLLERKIAKLEDSTTISTKFQKLLNFIQKGTIQEDPTPPTKQQRN